MRYLYYLAVIIMCNHSVTIQVYNDAILMNILITNKYIAYETYTQLFINQVTKNFIRCVLKTFCFLLLGP